MIYMQLPDKESLCDIVYAASLIIGFVAAPSGVLMHGWYHNGMHIYYIINTTEN